MLTSVTECSIMNIWKSSLFASVKFQKTPIELGAVLCLVNNKLFEKKLVYGTLNLIYPAKKNL